MKVLDDIIKVIERHPQRVVQLFRTHQIDAAANARNVSNALKIYGLPLFQKLLQISNPQSNFTDYSNLTGDPKPTLQAVIDGLARLSLGTSNVLRAHRGLYPMQPGGIYAPVYRPVMSNGQYYDYGAYDPGTIPSGYQQTGYTAEAPLMPRPNRNMLYLAAVLIAIILFLELKK